MSVPGIILPPLALVKRAFVLALKPRNLLRALCSWIKQKLIFWVLIAPVVFAICTVYHVYRQAFVVGGWNDAPGILIQPDVWMLAAARWTGIPAMVTGTYAFLRSAGLGSMRQIIASLHTVPAGAAALGCLQKNAAAPRTLETLLIAVGAGAVAGDVMMRILPAMLVLSTAVLLLLRGLGMAGSKREVPLGLDLTWSGWLFSVAGGLGLLLSWLYLGFYGMLALIGGGWLWYRRTHPGAPSTPAAMLLITWLAMTVVVLADDGNYDEYSPPSGQPKSLSGYLSTKDGQKTVGLGMIGGTLATLGAMFGSLFGTTLGNSFKEQMDLLQASAPPPIPTVTPPPPPPTPRDGDTNANGEVWSNEDRGWVGRNLYEQEKSRRTWIADKAEADLHTGQSEDVKKAYDAWQDSKAKLGEIQEQNREAERLRRIEQKHAELEALEAESTKGVQSSEVIDSFMRGVEDSTRSGIADLGSADVWREFGGNVKQDFGQLWDDAKEGALKGETYLNAGKAVLHSAKGMAEGIAMVGKAGWHVVAHPIDTTHLVLNAGGDPLAAVEFVTRTADQMVGSIVDPKKRLSERLQGVAKLEVEAVMGEGLGKAAGLVGELKAVKNLLNKVEDLKTGIFGKAAESTGQRIYGTGQTVGREAEQAAMAKLPPGHPARKIGEINEAAAKAGPEFNSRLVKGDRLLNDTNEAYQKGIDALKTDPKYLTPEAKKVADAVRYDQHLRAQQQAVKNMLAEHPELRGHLEGIENTGSHAWRRSDYKPGRSDIDINARGDGTALGKKVEETFPEYYRNSVKEVSGGKLSAEDLKANCYGDGKAQGALKSQTGKDFVESYKGTGKGRLDVFDNETGKFKHSLDGKDPLLNGDKKFFDRSNPAEAAGKAQEIHADVAAKHFEETAGLPMNEKLRQGAKNVKTIGNIAGKFTGQSLPEPIAKLVKNAAALEKLAPAAQQQALDVLEGFLKSH